MSNGAVKRMHSDIREFLKSSSLKEQGIFCTFDEDDVFRVRAMLVGPEDTPYEYGFYFFDMHFPQDYPFKPPHVTYETRMGRVRFHPNLYANSKVCLSILGTWSGPSWTSAQTLSSVLLTILSLLTKDPLTNEPGFETPKPHSKKDHENYESMVAFENYRTALFRMIEQPPNGFEAFVPIMHQCFVANASRIEKRLCILHERHAQPTKLHSRVYNFHTIVDYSACISYFYSIKHQLLPQSAVLAKTDEPEPDSHKQVATSGIQGAPTFEAPASQGQQEHSAILTAVPPVQKKIRIKKPKRKACEADLRGTIVTVEQGHGLEPVQYQSRKCKNTNACQPEKWQWRKLKQVVAAPSPPHT